MRAPGSNVFATPKKREVQNNKLKMHKERGCKAKGVNNLGIGSIRILQHTRAMGSAKDLGWLATQATDGGIPQENS